MKKQENIDNPGFNSLNAGLNEGKENRFESEGDKKNEIRVSSDDLNSLGSRDRDINPGSVKGPLVVLVGPGNCGKTVALMSLLRHLNSSGAASYQYVKSFIADTDYSTAIQKFDAALKDSKYNPERTQGVNFLLLELSMRGKYLCQILEAPGEHYFTPDDPDRIDFEAYQYRLLFGSSYPKIYIFFFEQDMLGGHLEAKYGARLAQIASHLNARHNDRVILLYNKVDEVRTRRGGMDMSTLKNEILNNPNYKGMVEHLRRSKGRLLFVPYSGGFFTGSREVSRKAASNQENLQWTPPSSEYPEALWKHIETAILNEDKSWWPW